jgi:hypothetical protein
MCISVARPAVAGRLNHGVGFLLPKKGERNCSVWLIPWTTGTSISTIQFGNNWHLWLLFSIELEKQFLTS